jgi:hypothetical protein
MPLKTIILCYTTEILKILCNGKFHWLRAFIAVCSACEDEWSYSISMFKFRNEAGISVLELFVFSWHVWLSVKFVSRLTLLSYSVFRVVSEKYVPVTVLNVLVAMIG